MKRTEDVGWPTWATILLLALAAVIVCDAFRRDTAHRQLLKEQGCVQEGEWETGKNISCGKACTRREKITLFECVSGRRIEIDGKEVSTGIKQQ